MTNLGIMKISNHRERQIFKWRHRSSIILNTKSVFLQSRETRNLTTEVCMSLRNMKKICKSFTTDSMSMPVVDWSGTLLNSTALTLLRFPRLPQCFISDNSLHSFFNKMEKTLPSTPTLNNIQVYIDENQQFQYNI